MHLTEVVIAPRSPAIGKTLKELRFRTKFGLTTVALWREGRSYRTDVGDFPLEAGDALLMVGAPGRIRLLAEEPGYIVLNRRTCAPAANKRKALLGGGDHRAGAAALGGEYPGRPPRRCWPARRRWC